MADHEKGVIPLNTVYRIVWTNPPTVEDFRSHAERGIMLRNTSKTAIRLYDGVSVFRTVSQARRTARQRPPWLGRGFIARVVIPVDTHVRIERTTKTAGHYTLWADAVDILSWVQGIESVTALKDHDDGV